VRVRVGTYLGPTVKVPTPTSYLRLPKWGQKRRRRQPRDHEKLRQKIQNPNKNQRTHPTRHTPHTTNEVVATKNDHSTMATTNQDLKRVISNPEAIMAESDREDKKTRVEDGMGKITLENQAGGGDDDDNIMGGERAPDQSDFPFSATMSQDGSRLSSLSGEEGSNCDDDSDEEEGEEEVPTGPGGVPHRKATSRIKRQVSQNDSMSNSNSSAENRQSSVTGGNWGWFEDVHGHESAFLPGFSAASGGESFGEGRKGDGSKERKKSGIWKMGSDLMQSALSAIVEPHKQGKEQQGSPFFDMVVFLRGWCVAIYLAR
jgi:hypothetical protein